MDHGRVAGADPDAGAEWAAAAHLGLPASLPPALEDEPLTRRLAQQELAMFLDFDGTLAPIVDSPEKAAIDTGMRETVRWLANLCTVAVVSGRDTQDVRNRVGVPEIHYAGSHGFEVIEPDGRRLEKREAKATLPALDRAEGLLREALRPVSGVLVERKRFAIAVHYRHVDPPDVPRVLSALDAAQAAVAGLGKRSGKMLCELVPDLPWGKGHAVLWLLRRLDLQDRDVLPLFVGDDVTDEDAFAALQADGIGIIVGAPPRQTAARYRLDDTQAVRRFLERCAGAQQARLDAGAG